MDVWGILTEFLFFALVVAFGIESSADYFGFAIGGFLGSIVEFAGCAVVLVIGAGFAKFVASSAE